MRFVDETDGLISGPSCPELVQTESEYHMNPPLPLCPELFENTGDEMMHTALQDDYNREA